jgi:hypothetical protein
VCAQAAQGDLDAKRTSQAKLVSAGALCRAPDAPESLAVAWRQALHRARGGAEQAWRI